MDRLLSPDEAAAILGVTADHVRRLCQTGELEHIKLGRAKNSKTRIEPRHLMVFIAGRVVQAKNNRGPGNPVLDEIARRRRAG